MPILPQEVKRKIQQRRIERLNVPDRLGEEGILHLVNFNDERYFAKEWYSVAEKRLTFPIESGSSPASPYWHKVKTYESHLIQAALPDLTLRVAASYDPRIVKNDAGEQTFAYQTGRPVHVTPEVKSDPDLQAQRDAIIGPTYDHMFDYHKQTQHGHLATPEQRATFYRVIADADANLEKLFGEDTLAISLTANQPLTEAITLQNAKKIADQTTVNDNGRGPAQMWKHGILPIHAHFNFIPEGKDESGAVQGKYIEVAIFDLNRYYNQVQAEQGDTAAQGLVSKIERYRMYRMLDDLFDQIIWEDYKVTGDDTAHSPEVQTAVFQLLEVVRSLCDKYSNSILDQLYQPILGSVGRIVESGQVSATMAAEITKLAQHIKTLPVAHEAQ